MHAVPDTVSLCRGLAHVLRPGAQFLIADHFRNRRWQYFRSVLEFEGFKLAGQEQDISELLMEQELLPSDYRFRIACFKRCL